MNPLYILSLIAVLVFAWEVWVEGILPSKAREALNRGDRAAELEMLQKIIATPVLLPGSARVNARFRLAAIYLEEGKYQDAAAECRMMLAARPGRAAQVNIRRRLADCLEFMGDTAGALQERNQVEKALQSGRESVDNCLSRGDELQRVQRHAEACAAYHRALELLPPPMTQVRGRVMVKLAVASFEAGEPEKTVEWAELSLQQGLEPKMQTLAHRMAGIGCSNMGWLDRAEEHYRQGLDAAKAVGNNEEIGKNMVQLAHVQELRGKLEEALDTCKEGAGMISSSDVRVVQMVEMESLRHLGRFDEARAVLIRAQHTPPLAAPAAERRSQATVSLGLAWLEADAGNAEQAWTHLQQATRVFMTDAKMNVSCEATLAWILALLGRREDAIRKAQEAEARAPQWARAPRTAQSCWSMPGRAYFVLGEFARSRECWEQYLSLAPDPVYLPMAFWYIGECSLRLGENERAREAFQQAVLPEIPTYYAERANHSLQGSH